MSVSTTKLREVGFEKCHLEYAEFAGCRLDFVSFSECLLSQAEFVRTPA